MPLYINIQDFFSGNAARHIFLNDFQKRHGIVRLQFQKLHGLFEFLRHNGLYQIIHRPYRIALPEKVGAAGKKNQFCGASGGEQLLGCVHAGLFLHINIQENYIESLVPCGFQIILGTGEFFQYRGDAVFFQVDVQI